MRFSVLLLGLTFCSSPTYAVVRHVPSVYMTIQDGIDAAGPSDIVLIADGTYTGAGNRDINFSGKAITVTSENGPAATIVDCENAGRGFIFMSGEGPNSVISGLTIRNATGVLGGAVYSPGSSATITGNVIEYCTGSNSGAIYLSGGTPTVTGNTIRENTGPAGAGLNIQGNALIENNVVTNNHGSNSGGAIASFGTATPIIRGNFILDNDAHLGAGIYITSGGTFENNIICGNTSNAGGGGIRCNNTSFPIIRNNTIAENTALEGAGIYCIGSTAVIEHNILAFNRQGEGIFCSSSGPQPTVSCCDIFGNDGGDALCGTDGGNNLFENPRFCSALGSRDYSLAFDSPCAGKTSPGCTTCGLIGAVGPGCGTPDNHTYFHVDDFAGIGGGSFGNLNPLQGNQSLWCGARPGVGDPDLQCYQYLPGYGDDWNQGWESEILATSGDITVIYQVRWHYEAGDAFWFEYMNAAGTWQPFPALPAGSGFSVESHFIPQSGLSGGDLKVRFRFKSDFDGSDQSGPDTDGAVIIDSLAIMDSSLGQISFEDFECEAVGAVQTCDGRWNADPNPTGIRLFAATGTRLGQNFPNPFNPTTTIAFELKVPTRVTLRVYDVTGRLVTTLLDEERPAGDNFVPWDGRNSTGNNVGSGVYFYALQTERRTFSRKMVLIK